MSDEHAAPVEQAPTADDLLLESRSSGLTIAAFARSKGVPAWKLYNAKRRAERAAPKRAASGLIPVRLISGAEQRERPLELRLNSGYRLVVPNGFDEHHLRRLMGVLASC